jgi:hypothetical protein
MLTTEVIFGVSDISKNNKQEINHAILISEYEAWPLGTPILIGQIPKENELLKSDSRMPGRILISPNGDCDGYGYNVNPYIDLIRPINLKPLVPRHKVLTVTQFLTSKLPRLIEYVHDMGSISFCITSKYALTHLVVDYLKDFAKHFKYNTVTSCRWPGDKKYLASEKDIVFGVLTFIDIVYCIPIFDTKKVDGVGMNFSLVTKEASEKYGSLHRLATIDMILSNYSNNVFVVDGSLINNNRPLDDNTINVLYNAINTKVEVRPDADNSYSSAAKEKFRISKIAFESEPSLPSSWEIDQPLFEGDVFDTKKYNIDISSGTSKIIFDEGVWINTSNNTTSQSEEE